MTNLNLTNSEGICCGLFSCMEAQGLFDGVSREEKLALRRAQEAERAFRISKGYERENLADHIRKLLKI